MKQFLIVSFVMLLVAVLVIPTVHLRGSSMPFNVGIVKKSVVFLYYLREDEFEVGTGFLVEIPSKVNPERSFVVIVTARHIVDPQWAGCSWSNPHEVYARVNAKNYTWARKARASTN